MMMNEAVWPLTSRLPQCTQNTERRRRAASCIASVHAVATSGDIGVYAGPHAGSGKAKLAELEAALDAVLEDLIQNGVTKEEMREIFIQVGTYCGMPAALEAFKIAQEVFDEMGV